MMMMATMIMMTIKFIERSFSKKKKNNQEKDIKMIRKIKILKSSLPTISIASGTSFQHE